MSYLLWKIDSITTSFDLSMLKGAYDIFAFVINFLKVDWQPKHIAIRLFETFDTFGHALARYLAKLLSKCDLREKIIAYVKDEGSNLNIMTITLKSVVSYDGLSLTKHFKGNCFAMHSWRFVNML
jgi:hypothetical protein